MAHFTFVVVRDNKHWKFLGRGINSNPYQSRELATDAAITAARRKTAQGYPTEVLLRLDEHLSQVVWTSTQEVVPPPMQGRGMHSFRPAG